MSDFIVDLFQAYWDETSKQVYYGNTITAKTTWTRPKK